MHAPSAVRPSRLWYWLAGGLLLAAVVAIVVAVTNLVWMNRQVRDFTRIPVPGQATVTLAEPGEYVLYAEGPGQSDDAATGTVTAHLEPANGGPAIAPSQSSLELSYALGGYEGRSVGTFHITQPGEYLLRAGDPDTPDITHVAVGPSVARGIFLPIVLILAAVLLLTPAALVVGGATFALRRRARRRLQAGSVPPPVPAPAGWHPDPARRHEYRYWNGAQWTEHVSDHGVRAVDPLVEDHP